jgi:uncharacterized protein (DUF2141 family)
MLKIYSKFLLVILFLVSIGCAKRGNITGGEKDTLAPVLDASIPKNFSTNFDGKIIKLYFNEYVKLKDINKQLVVSPPMNSPPEVFPANSSKFLTIKIKDTLQPNTTYSFNFGQSIQDNNEGNPYSQFKYVFSTGSYIDSLSIKGTIKDALEQTTDNFVNVMLYEKNDLFTDSIIYKEKPRYVTNTLDSLTAFKIENIKAGNYLLVAVKDSNKNYKFDPKSDRIGFYSQPITVPSAENYELALFRETPTFKALKPSQAAGNRLTMGYEGNPKAIEVLLKNGNEIIPTLVTQLPDKDSVNVWFQPVKADSLQFSVSKEKFNKDFSVKIKSQALDSLKITAEQSGVLEFRSTFTLKSTTPLVQFDATKMSLRNKDSVLVVFTNEYDAFEQNLKINFKKAPSEQYTFELLPGALIDFFEKANDTLSFKMATKSTSDYGNLTLNLKNIKQFPIIVELTDAKGKVLATEYSENNATIVFEGLEPNKFMLRVIYDDNKNKVWDAGNYLGKRQSETVIYFPSALDVRANWDVNQDFDLGE